MVVFLIAYSSAAPAFRFKKILRTYDADRYFPRSDRRQASKASPIHFITPFMGVPQPVQNFNNFFAQQPSMGIPTSSSMYKLPLRLYSNGKPHTVYHGIPKKQNVIEYLPHTVSNIIRLPLKYISNAKPVGVYFKDPAFNFLWNWCHLEALHLNCTSDDFFVRRLDFWRDVFELVNEFSFNSHTFLPPILCCQSMKKKELERDCAWI